MLYREAGQFKTTYAADQQLFPIRQDKIGVLVLLAVAFFGVPLLASEYWFSAILIPFLIFALAALGLNILTGYAGQLSLGSAAFMAVGAYAAYNFQLRIEGMPILVSFICGGLTAAGVGVLFGLPSLRIKGFYLAVAALAAKNLVRSSTGRAWMAVRDMDVAASVIGIKLMPTKLLAFAISSFYCGVAGAMYAFCYLGSVEPDGFSLEMSFKILFMIIIGGVGSIMGSFLGAAFILLLPILLDVLLPFLAGLFGLPFSSATVSHIQILVFGALIMFFLIVEPHGLARLWQIAKEKLRLWPFPH